jgi:acetylornithine deacetylase/succinyl-diaminopimelate desuccinylase-like protein
VPLDLKRGDRSLNSATPDVTSGHTENPRCRPLGVVIYGFKPYTATEEEGNTEHGNDERMRVEEVRRGPRVLFDVVAGR